MIQRKERRETVAGLVLAVQFPKRIIPFAFFVSVFSNIPIYSFPSWSQSLSLIVCTIYIYIIHPYSPICQTLRMSMKKWIEKNPSQFAHQKMSSEVLNWIHRNPMYVLLCLNCIWTPLNGCRKAFPATNLYYYLTRPLPTDSTKYPITPRRIF
jgi:hypothetical protein